MKNLILIVLFAIAAASVYISIEAGNAATVIRGPNTLVEDREGRIWILMMDTLFLLDRNGASLTERDAKTFADQESSKPDTYDMIADPEGNVWIASGNAKAIHRLDNIGITVESIAFSDASEDELNPGFKFTFLQNGERIGVADTFNHRIRLYDSVGFPIVEVGKRGKNREEFNYPNRISTGPDGRLYIADTRNKRIVVMNKKAEWLYVIDTSIDESVTDYAYPTQFDFTPIGDLAVIRKNSTQTNGEIAIFGGSEKRELVKTIALRLGADPERIIAREHDFLVTDYTAFQILRYDWEGNRLDNFGDETFVSKLNSQYINQKNLETRALTSRMVIVVALIGLLLVAMLEKKAQAEKTRKALLESDRISVEPNEIKALPASLIIRRILFMTVEFIAFTFGLATLITFGHMPVNFVLPLLIIPPVLMVYRWGQLIKAGLLLRFYQKQSDSVFGKLNESVFEKLDPGEKVIFFTLIRKAGDFRDILSDRIKEVVLLVMTPNQMLLIDTNAYGSHVRSSESIRYDSIGDILIEEQNGFQRFCRKYLGFFFLTITHAGSVKPLVILFLNLQVGLQASNILISK